MKTSLTLATTNAGILETLERALDSIHSASAAAELLASHLSPILPTGAPEAINELLSAGNHHEDGHEHESALECLIGSLGRHADALRNALEATHEAVRL